MTSWRCIFCYERFNYERGLLDHACEGKRTQGEIAQAERDEAAYQAHVKKYENAIYFDPEADYR
jgi:hypothetical protein